jgi:hypothetical protein
MHLLDNPIWTALNTRQAHFACGGTWARRFAPQVTALAGFSEMRGEAYEELSGLADGAPAALFLHEAPDLPEGWSELRQAPLLQMVYANGASPAPRHAWQTLTEADVPDMVWKVGNFKRGGPNSPEHANHFADMDRELDPPLPEGATLLDICRGKPQNVAVDVWRRYYDAVQKQFPAERESRGLLPFRVWQIYDAMVAAVKAGEVEIFVCAAGILSHYVGDR